MPQGRTRYILNLILCGFIPTLLLLSRLSWNEILLILAIYLALLPFYILWDSQTTLHAKTRHTWVWEFSSETLLGPKLFGVPVEELMFMFLATAFPIGLWKFFISLRTPPMIQWTAILILLVTAPLLHSYVAKKG